MLSKHQPTAGPVWSWRGETWPGPAQTRSESGRVCVELSAGALGSRPLGPREGRRLSSEGFGFESILSEPLPFLACIYSFVDSSPRSAGSSLQNVPAGILTPPGGPGEVRQS